MSNLKRSYLVFMSVLLMILSVPTYATNDISNQTQEFTPVRSTEYPISNGVVKLVDNGNYIMLQKITTVDCDSKNRSSSTSHIAETETQMIVPYCSTAHNEIYDEILNSVESSLDSIGQGYLDSEESDQYYCAKFYLRVDFTRETKDDGFRYYDFTKVSGGFTDSDSTTSGDYVGENVYVTSQSIDVSQNGSTYDEGVVLDQVIFDYAIPTSKRSWSYIPPANWVAICGDDQAGMMAAAYRFTLSRGAASWTESIVINAII